jgi:hypothetical protein
MANQKQKCYTAHVQSHWEETMPILGRPHSFDGPIPCPNCETKLRVQFEAAGHRSGGYMHDEILTCKSCGTQFNRFLPGRLVDVMLFQEIDVSMPVAKGIERF